jgi:hypothetical protein
MTDIIKAYKIEILVLDFEDNGEESIKDTVEGSRFLNAKVMSSRGVDVDWSDDHPLNHCGTSARAYQDLFAVNKVNK